MATGILRGIWDEALWDLIKGMLGGLSKGTSERIQERIKRSSRQDMVFTLLTMERDDRVKLMDAFEEYLREGRENRIIRELGRLLPRTAEDKLDDERARRLLKELNSVSEDELRMFLEFLTYDPVAQWFRYWVLDRGKEAAIRTAEVVAELAGHGIHLVQNQVPEAAGRIDYWVENTAAPAIRQFRMSQKWIKRSRRRRRRLEIEVQEQGEQMRQQREQQTRERVAELYDQIRRWANRRGEQR